MQLVIFIQIQAWLRWEKNWFSLEKGKRYYVMLKTVLDQNPPRIRNKLHYSLLLDSDASEKLNSDCEEKVQALTIVNG